jgi:hypothetical protein
MRLQAGLQARNYKVNLQEMHWSAAPRLSRGRFLHHQREATCREDYEN